MFNIYFQFVINRPCEARAILQTSLWLKVLLNEFMLCPPKYVVASSMTSSSSADQLQDLFQPFTILPCSTSPSPIPNRLGLMSLLLPGHHCYSGKPESRSQYIEARSDETVFRSQYLGANI